MKFKLSQTSGMLIKILIMSLLPIFLLASEASSYDYIADDINREKTVNLIYSYIDFNTVERINTKLPLFTTKVVSEGERGIIATTKYNHEPVLIKEPQDRIIEFGKANPKSFTGALTGYGPDCIGCGGRVSCNSKNSGRQDVRNGNIFYNDEEYGKIRIVAADKNIPCGTIIEISNFIFEPDPVIAVVLDRGGVINGTLFDLLYPSEKDTTKIGYQRNIKYKILRWGW